MSVQALFFAWYCLPSCDIKTKMVPAFFPSILMPEDKRDFKTETFTQQNYTQIDTGSQFCATKLKRSMYISDFVQPTFFYLGRFLKKLANDQFSSVSKGSVSTTCVHTTFTMEVN